METNIYRTYKCRDLTKLESWVSGAITRAYVSELQLFGSVRNFFFVLLCATIHKTNI